MNQERPSGSIYIQKSERRNRKKSRALSCTKRFEDEVVVVDEDVVDVGDPGWASCMPGSRAATAALRD